MALLPRLPRAVADVVLTRIRAILDHLRGDESVTAQQMDDYEDELGALADDLQMRELSRPAPAEPKAPPDAHGRADATDLPGSDPAGRRP